MKRGLLLIVSLLAVASVAFAQPGSIGVFADQTGTSCDITDAAPGLVNVYLVHVNTPGATACQFQVTWDAGQLMTFLSEAVTPPYIGIGTSQVGMAIAYGSCVPSPNKILTYSFFAAGISTPCAMFHVKPDGSTVPPKQHVLVTSCSNPPLLLNATGGEAVINTNGTCDCDVAVEETSWGQIKSLYL
ncbi:MAG: hypothetical protein ABIA59_08135 [Candidatus Latescibacterota bacterium]